jgi:hypothetical protein
MKVIIAGGRDFNDFELLKDKCDIYLSQQSNVEIVSGTANGADKLGERYAKESNLKLTKFPADWDLYGRGAGPIRNKEMADYADSLVVFWDGKSKGTENMIAEARKRGLSIRIIKY